MSRLDGALWNMLCPTASPHVSLLFQARGKCLSITMVYYVCACIHGTPQTFWFTCVGKKAENIGRRPLSTSPQTCCPLVTSRCCSHDPLFMRKSTCNSHGVGCICLWLEGACCSSCCPVQKKKMKKIIPFLFICVFFVEKWVNYQISPRDHHFRWADSRLSSKVWRHKACWPSQEIKNPTSLKFWTHTHTPHTHTHIDTGL